ncbi:glycosyltransferase family 2 protein [bacterium]|nr:glycosyltransferase family 2 protein [bacterium]
MAIVIPAFNEELCLPELVKRLKRVFDSETQYRFRCIIVENGSRDCSWEIITDEAASDERIEGVQLSRNYGADGGITAGLDLVDEDAAILMTADLQDPPEVIPKLLRQWELGYENVYGVVTRRVGTGPLRRMNSRAFYWLAARLSDNQIPENASDFRLLDRRAYQAVRSLRERNRMMRGLAAWVGFRSCGVPFERPQRYAGSSKATTKTVMRLATQGIFSNSVKPLRLITLVGTGLSVFALISIVILAILWLFRGVPFAGFGTLVSISLLAFGLLSLMVGIVAEYVGLIYEEVRQRPIYLVRQMTHGRREN